MALSNLAIWACVPPIVFTINGVADTVHVYVREVTNPAVLPRSSRVRRLLSSALPRPILRVSHFVALLPVVISGVLLSMQFPQALASAATDYGGVVQHLQDKSTNLFAILTPIYLMSLFIMFGVRDSILYKTPTTCRDNNFANVACYLALTYCQWVVFGLCLVG